MSPALRNNRRVLGTTAGLAKGVVDRPVHKFLVFFFFLFYQL